MFSARKYTPLPTSSGQQRKRSGGGLAAWKRWIMLGGAVLILLALGYSYSSSSQDVSSWEDDRE